MANIKGTAPGVSNFVSRDNENFCRINPDSSPGLCGLLRVFCAGRLPRRSQSSGRGSRDPKAASEQLGSAYRVARLVEHRRLDGDCAGAHISCALAGGSFRRVPLAHIAVINRGINGEDALEEVARLDSDATALHPDMVIWQVGANGAMGHADPAVFSKLVATGIERLQARNIDVVLMDNQRSPMILASPVHTEMEEALADLAVKYNVALFSRGALMDSWKQQGYQYAEFLANDGVHMNDRGYRCLADALAISIEQGLGLSVDRTTVAHGTN